jgi:proline iminopeptidase
MADDLELFRLHLGESGAHRLRLTGHSDGGSIILACASRYPERVEALVLVSHRLQDYECKDGDIFKEKRKDHPIYGPALKALTASKPPSTDSEFAASLATRMPYYFADPTKVHGRLKSLLGDSISL